MTNRLKAFLAVALVLVLPAATWAADVCASCAAGCCGLCCR